MSGKLKKHFAIHLRILTAAIAAVMLLTAQAGSAQIPPPTAQEKAFAVNAKEKSDLFPRKNIILSWPCEMKVEWYKGSKVDGPGKLADWLEKCYCLAADWTDCNPNDTIYNPGGKASGAVRLLFIHNGQSDYHFVSRYPRPYIGLRDFAGAGSEDWFGWLTHELSHEFFIYRPEARRFNNGKWVEAFCDYFRYHLLLASGMTDAAANWKELMRSCPPGDCYRGGAWIILSYQEKHALKGPKELWEKVRATDWSETFGEPQW